MNMSINKIKDAMEWGIRFDAVVAPTLSGDKWLVILHQETAQGGSLGAGLLSRQRGGEREFKTLDAAGKTLADELGITEFTVKTDPDTVKD